VVDLYTVYYRKVGARRWRKLEKIQEDGIIPDTQIRFFINKYKERFELPMSQIELKFPEERAEIAEAYMEEEKKKINIP
jgi:hypothetical protein